MNGTRRTISRQDRALRVDRTLAYISFLTPLAGVLVAVGMWIGGYSATRTDIFLLAGMYLLTMTGIEVGYHRYFSHRAFKAGPAVDAGLAILGSMAFQGPVIWWAALHRLHHGNTDALGDPHSPHLSGTGWRNRVTGFCHAHSGWLFKPECTKPEGWERVVADLYKSKPTFYVHMSYLYWAMLGLLIPAVVGGVVSGSLLGAFTGFLWGGLIRIFLVHHAFWSVNSLCHVSGSRPFKLKGDYSRNNLLVVLPTLGQGLHNNHHAFPWSAYTGLRWYQLDLGGAIISTLGRVGLVWNVRSPSKEQVTYKLNRLDEDEPAVDAGSLS